MEFMRKRTRSAETGTGQLSETSQEDGLGKKKKKISGLYKPPTHSELQNLKETQDLFRSNLMKLQITELLSEVKPRKETAAQKHLDAALHSLKDALTSMPQSERVNLCDGLSLLPTKVRYPLRLDLVGVKGSFQFLPPASVKVVGGYLLGTLTKPDLNVELALSIPETCVQAKDRQSFRYFHKRALYLSLIAGHLKRQRKSLGIAILHFSTCQAHPLLPVLVVTPSAKQLSKYRITLHTTLPDGYFANLPLTTPHYSNALRWECGARERTLHEVYTSTQDCPALTDAVVLCKVWTRQRQLDRGYGCVQELHFAMLGVALLQQKKISGLMSSYQILRIMLQHLATNDWTVKGLSLASNKDSSLPSLEVFRAAFDVVFLDSTGLLNLCGEMTKDRFHWLSHEAAIALDHLNDQTTFGFQHLFMKPQPPELKFDILCHISPRGVFEECGEAVDKKDSLGWPLPLHVKRVWPLLLKGLGKRIKLIAQLPFPELEWGVSHRSPDPNDGHLILGLLLDAEHAFSIIDMGPPADSTKAAEDFRVFWGAKSELRRFQDGSINEAVVWVESKEDVAGRRSVCELIVKHLLERHAGVTPDHVTSTATALDSLITLPGTDSTGEEQSAKVQSVFTELSRELRSLRDLPLSITSLQGASSAFSHADLFPAQPWSGKMSSKFRADPSKDCQSDCLYPASDHATPSFTPALEVVCHLESSGKWPDDLAAIAKMKTAFNLYIAKAANEQRRLFCSPTEQFVDIFKSGLVFRLRIHCHRELSLLADALTVSGAAPPPKLARLKQQRADLERREVLLPVHTSTMNGLHQQFPAFSPGTRLCKRWISSHLLSNHFSDEAVDLMVAYLFLRPSSGVPPGSHTTVLLRFLSLLVSHDWVSEPLIVDPNNELSLSVVSEITSKLTSNRSGYPSFFIATPLHRDSTPWSTPPAPIAARLQLLAKECLTYLSQQLSLPQNPHTDLKVAFREPLSDYDALIHLERRHLPLSSQAVDATPIASSPTHRPKHKRVMPVVNFDPVQFYLQDLVEAFSEFAFFFYDKYGGKFIAVVWKPEAFAPQPFKVLHAHCRVVSAGSGGRMVPDVDALLAAFTMMGQGLVSRVELLQK